MRELKGEREEEDEKAGKEAKRVAVMMMGRRGVRGWGGRRVGRLVRRWEY